MYQDQNYNALPKIRQCTADSVFKHWNLALISCHRLGNSWDSSFGQSILLACWKMGQRVWSRPTKRPSPYAKPLALLQAPEVDILHGGDREPLTFKRRERSACVFGKVQGSWIIRSFHHLWLIFSSDSELAADCTCWSSCVCYEHFFTLINCMKCLQSLPRTPCYQHLDMKFWNIWLKQCKMKAQLQERCTTVHQYPHVSLQNESSESQRCWNFRFQHSNDRALRTNGHCRQVWASLSIFVKLSQYLMLTVHIIVEDKKFKPVQWKVFDIAKRVIQCTRRLKWMFIDLSSFTKRCLVFQVALPSKRWKVICSLQPQWETSLGLTVPHVLLNGIQHPWQARFLKLYAPMPLSLFQQLDRWVSCSNTVGRFSGSFSNLLCLSLQLHEIPIACRTVYKPKCSCKTTENIPGWLPARRGGPLTAVSMVLKELKYSSAIWGYFLAYRFMESDKAIGKMTQQDLSYLLRTHTGEKVVSADKKYRFSELLRPCLIFHSLL